MGLEDYKRKRDFKQTPEPAGAVTRADQRRFVVQEHHASRLHFDFRLEMGGVLKSWAVPKGPSLNPQQKRLAVMTEDHPVQYLTFEGHIAEGNYGAGDMVIWDHGHYAMPAGDDPLEGIERGRLTLHLSGEKLRGAFSLVRTRMGDKRRAENQWLLIKSNDEWANPAWELETILPDTEATRNQKPPVMKGKVVTRVEPPQKAGAPSASGVRKGQGKKSKSGDSNGPAVPIKEVFSTGFKGEYVQAQVGDDVLSLTHLSKFYWPDEGYTNRDLLQYYFNIADTILPYLWARPLILKRYPNGITGHAFFQHNIEEAPAFLPTAVVEVQNERGQSETIRYALCNNLAALLYLVNLGNIAFNPWHSGMDDPDHPNWIVFDLDPGEVDFSVVCQVALAVQEVLDSVALECYPKTSGSSGLHIYVPMAPVHSYEQAADFAERVARVVQKAHPTLATLERSLKKREKAEVYLDHLQNAQGKTVVAPYSVRARPGATVSTPLKWSEVASCPHPQEFTIKTLHRRLKAAGDLFEPVLSGRQTLDNALSVLKSRPRRLR